MKTEKERIVEIVQGLAEYYDKTLSKSQILMYVEDLSGISPDILQHAVKLYRRDPKNVFFPLPAKLLEAAMSADGRPGVEEAWSMMPRSESQTIVWTEEMSGAFAAVNAIEDDPVAQRMAFKEVYTKLVNEARAAGKPAKWTPSLGHNPRERASVLKEAVEKGRLTIEHVNSLLPEPLGDIKKLGFDTQKILKQIPKEE